MCNSISFLVYTRCNLIQAAIQYLPSIYKMQFNKLPMHTREIRCAIQQSFLYIQDATLQNFKYMQDAILYLSSKYKMQSNNLSMLTKYIRCGIQFFSMDRLVFNTFFYVWSICYVIPYLSIQRWVLKCQERVSLSS